MVPPLTGADSESFLVLTARGENPFNRQVLSKSSPHLSTVRSSRELTFSQSLLHPSQNDQSQSFQSLKLLPFPRQKFTLLNLFLIKKRLLLYEHSPITLVFGPLPDLHTEDCKFLLD